MTQTIEMKDAEKQVFRLALFEDGIWEIYLGIIFFVMSFYDTTRDLLGPVVNAALVLGLTLILAAIAVIAKRQIIQPRTGIVNFGPQAQKKLKRANLIILILVLATFILLILGANTLIQEPGWELVPQWFRDFDIDLLFALIITGILCLVGYYTGVARFYLHGILLGVGNFSSTVLKASQDVQFGWPLAAAGLIITGIGIFVLVKFLQERPTPVEEASNGR